MQSIQNKCLGMWDSLLTINMRNCCSLASSKQNVNCIMYIYENRNVLALLLGYNGDEYYTDRSRNLYFLNLWWMTVYQGIKTIR